MFTATMIAKPGMLDPVLAGSIQSAWGGSELRWLSAAAEDLLVESGPTDEMFEAALHPYTQALLSAALPLR